MKKNLPENYTKVDPAGVTLMNSMIKVNPKGETLMNSTYGKVRP